MLTRSRLAAAHAGMTVRAARHTARHPDEPPALVPLKAARSRRPEVITLHTDLADALDRSPDEPHLAGLAGRIDAVRAADEKAGNRRDVASDDLAALLGSICRATTRRGHRLPDLLEQRGRSGWTDARRIPRREEAAC